MQTQNTQTAPVISLKEWIISVFITFIPVIGLIMLVLWAFSGKETNPNRRNWAKALLIIQVAGLVLVILIYAFLAVWGLVMYNKAG
ncbi:MAG TPA: hypothetical protein DIT04_11780 [Dysgonomonas sp.]|nr:hypothetical protein [Dysgonomonas sp.]